MLGVNEEDYGKKVCTASIAPTVAKRPQENSSNNSYNRGDNTRNDNKTTKRTKPNPPAPCSPETQKKRLLSREKQIQYGKATLGYSEYLRLVPLKNRSPTQPRTPNKNLECSKRCWDGLVARWRRQLHAFDPVLKD